jgi:hypothetical protein
LELQEQLLLTHLLLCKEFLDLILKLVDIFYVVAELVVALEMADQEQMQDYLLDHLLVVEDLEELVEQQLFLVDIQEEVLCQELASLVEVEVAAQVVQEEVHLHQLH